MSSAPSLYRRHRPRTFGEVVGQEHVVRTLRNAVQRGRVHHAHLFVGARGTGKTSMAKILAACLNCERGPTTEPCGDCASCTAIAAATSLDVIEMDAASNNSVDDIRDLREKVGYAPVSGRHKVYILDEAHMLSTQAWNAFLKTLEEPPPSTIFVLATTEAQKILPTVVDRCHRFDFTRPSVEHIVTVLRRAAGAEGIDIPDAALMLVARAAGGSFRDALGTLEQLVTYSSGAGSADAADARIELDDVLAVLGVTEADLLFDAVDAIATHDARQALRAATRLTDAGRDPGRLFGDLEAHARELLVVQTLGEVPSELRTGAERDERLVEQAGALGREDVVRLLDLLAAGMEARKAGADPRIQLELALVKAAAPEVDPSSRALLARIDRLEARLGGPDAAASPRPLPERAMAADTGERPVPPARPEGQPPPPIATAPAPALAPDSAAVAVAVAPVPPPAVEEPLDLEGLRELWPAVVGAVRGENAMLAALIADARPVSLIDGELTVAFPADAAFLKRKADGDAHRRTATEALRAVSGRPLRLAYELRADLPAAATGDAGTALLSGEELVERFVAEFDAEEIVADREAD